MINLQTDPGCVRGRNEDAGTFVIPREPLHTSKGAIALVADGMGGHLAGEVASKMATEIIPRAYYDSDKPPAESLKQAFEESNRQIHSAALADQKLAGMGTTATALVVYDHSAIAAHVGDSRLYLMRDDQIYQMTEDHSAVMQMVKAGIISAAEARNHDDKNVIVRALGTSSEVEVSMWDAPLTVREGDQFLLCSDGLYDLVENEEIRELVLAANNQHVACERLIELAKSRGGHDNITVGIVNITPASTVETNSVRETREVEVSV